MSDRCRRRPTRQVARAAAQLFAPEEASDEATPQPRASIVPVEDRLCEPTEPRIALGRRWPGRRVQPGGGRRADVRIPTLSGQGKTACSTHFSRRAGQSPLCLRGSPFRTARSSCRRVCRCLMVRRAAASWRVRAERRRRTLTFGLGRPVSREAGVCTQATLALAPVSDRAPEDRADFGCENGCQ
jgi:hypothetical protein